MTRQFIKYQFLIIGLLTCTVPLLAQQINFHKINVSNGLSDNLVLCATLDQNGLMWIGTGTGLDSYNGYDVAHWSHPEKTEWVVSELYCDAGNRIWIEGSDGVLWILNRQRHLQQVGFINKKDSGEVRYFFPVDNGHVYVWVDNYLGEVDTTTLLVKKIRNLPDSIARRRYQQKTDIGNGEYLVAGASRVLHLDMPQGKLKRVIPVHAAMASLMLPNGNYLTSTENDAELFEIEPASGRVVRNFGEWKDQFDKPVNGYLRRLNKLSDGRICITSGYAGLYILDLKKQTLTNYAHDPLDEQSISGNNTFRLSSDTAGNVFISTRSSGLNYFNLHLKQAQYMRVLKDSRSGVLFDGFVECFAENKKGDIFLGTQAGLARLDKNNHTVQFLPYAIIDGFSVAGTEEVRALNFDHNNRLWVGLNRYGVAVLNDQLKPVKYLNTRAVPSEKLRSNFINFINQGPGQTTWISSSRGLDIVDNKKLNVINSPAFNGLKDIQGRNVYTTCFQTDDSVWIAVSRGIYCYQLSTNKLTHFGKEKGFTGKGIYSIAKDTKGNMFFSGTHGVEVLKKNGEILFFNQSNGLPYNIGLVLLPQADGTVWVSNDYCMAVLDADKGVVQIADNRFGMPRTGFRHLAGLQASSGLMYVGANEGYITIDPSGLFDHVPSGSILINALETVDEKRYFTDDATVHLPYSRNNFEVYLNNISLFDNTPRTLLYMLEGYDETWKRTNGSEPLQYREIPWGDYTLRVKYLNEDDNAIAQANKLQIIVRRPWWASWWFIALTIALLGAIIIAVVKFLWNRRKARQDELETERAVLYFANNMHQYHNFHDIVKDLTQNSVSRLGFEDCVVYLLDEKREVLKQVSAWGSKLNDDGTILHPIEIPMGKGIVGAVAQTGKYEIIGDTSQDSRYIPDDKVRYAEIAVPIIAEDKVIGIIDSEHSQKHFFNQKHLSLLTTLASLLGSRMVSILAEQEKRAAEIALHATQKRTAEVEMQALRAQMNPHFMFNSLNSINNFILKNDADNASAYLTRFSRLMRLILDNSRQDWVTLDNELKALKLYIDMETIRFDHAFECQLKVSDDINVDYVMIPPLLIQPYVENAIWHGLMHRKSPGGILHIDVSKVKGYLQIVVEDNGIGRAEAAKLKSKLGEQKKSHGMKITGERLRIVNEIYHVDAHAAVDDLIAEDGVIDGTRVELRLKYKTHIASHSEEFLHD